MRIQNYLAVFSLTLFTAVSMNGTAHAQNKVVVIPMAGDAEPLQNIITVSAQNGDFTSPIAAMNSINDASSSQSIPHRTRARQLSNHRPAGDEGLREHNGQWYGYLGDSWCSWR